MQFVAELFRRINSARDKLPREAPIGKLTELRSVEMHAAIPSDLYSARACEYESALASRARFVRAARRGLRNNVAWLIASAPYDGVRLPSQRRMRAEVRARSSVDAEIGKPSLIEDNVVR